MIQIDSRITSGIHPVTAQALMLLRNEEKGNLGKFEEFLKNWIADERKDAELKFVELLNHNKKKIFINEFEDRTVNEIFLDMEFLRGLVNQ